MTTLSPPLFWLAALFGHGLLWVEVVNRLHGYGWPRKLVDAATAACGGAVAAPPIAIGWALASGTDVGPIGVGYAWLSIVALGLIAATRGALAWDPQRDRRRRDVAIDRVDLHAATGGQATAGGLVKTLAAAPGNELLSLATERFELPVDGLPTECDGLRVAHLTDLHMSGRLTRRYFEEVVRLTNLFEPDVVAVTGDIVEHAPQLDWVDPVLGALRARLGAWFVLGNHDEKVDCEELRRLLVAAGLRDAGRGPETVAVGDATLRVVGDERPWFPACDALDAADGDASLRLRLVHTPDRFAAACAAGEHLVLAGHNHGGQVC
ncbi:MAG: metallophosphoesterase, partial [Planctomycetota bacterium]